MCSILLWPFVQMFTYIDNCLTDCDRYRQKKDFIADLDQLFNSKFTIMRFQILFLLMNEILKISQFKYIFWGYGLITIKMSSVLAPKFSMLNIARSSWQFCISKLRPKKKNLGGSKMLVWLLAYLGTILMTPLRQNIWVTELLRIESDSWRFDEFITRLINL